MSKVQISNNSNSSAGLFDQDDIDGNIIYGPLMKSINDLYVKHGCPVELKDTRTTTTGNHIDDQWNKRNIGDWGGLEAVAASFAQSQLQEVFIGLGLGGNGGIRYYYQTEEWRNFIAEAMEELDNYSAWDILCGLDPMADMGLRDELISVYVDAKHAYIFESGQHDDELLEIRKAAQAVGTECIYQLYVDYVINFITNNSQGEEVVPCKDYFKSLVSTLEDAISDM